MKIQNFDIQDDVLPYPSFSVSAPFIVIARSLSPKILLFSVLSIVLQAFFIFKRGFSSRNTIGSYL